MTFGWEKGSLVLFSPTLTPPFPPHFFLPAHTAAAIDLRRPIERILRLHALPLVDPSDGTAGRLPVPPAPENAVLCEALAALAALLGNGINLRWILDKDTGPLCVCVGARARLCGYVCFLVCIRG